MGAGGWGWARAAGVWTLALSSILVAACGDSAPRVPTGDPLEVVRESADVTVNAGLATVYVDSPGESASAAVDLAREVGPEEIRARALEALELARRATKATAYGGQQVRGASTMRYEVTPEGGGRLDVWVDVAGRARRIQFPPGDLSATPPPTQPNGLPALVSIDFEFPDAQLRAGEPDL